jgi:TPP-dependent pyruvate/acetoin dehydrogenase alpha subunit
LEKEIRQEISQAEKVARESPFPDDVELYHDIYSTDVPVRGVEFSNSYAPASQ